MSAVVTKPATKHAVPAGMVEVTSKAAMPVETNPAKPEAVIDAAAAEALKTPDSSIETQTTEEASASKRAKDAADKARKGAQKNRELQEQHQRLERQQSQYAAETQRLQAQLEQANQIITGFSQDPITTLERLGVPAEEIARRMAMKGSPEAKFEALERMLMEERQERLRLVEGQRAKEEAARAELEQNAYKQEAQNAKKYPTVATWPPDVTLAATEKLIGQLANKAIASGLVAKDDRKGMQRYLGQFSNHDLLEYLDSTYATGRAKVETPEETSPDAPKKTATITNKLQTAKHVAPPDPAKLTDRQWKKWAADELLRTAIKK